MDRFRDLDKDLFDLMPSAYRETDNGELEDLCHVFQQEIETWDDMLDLLESLPRPDRCPAGWLRYLAGEYGVSLPTLLTNRQARALLGDMVSVWKRKGDLKVIRDVIRLLTGLSVLVFAYWDDPDQWVMGESEMQENTQIGISYRKADPDMFIAGYSKAGVGKAGDRSYGRADIWTFQIWVYRQPTARELILIYWVARLLKRAEDHFEVYWPETTGYWIFGDSRIGLDTIVGPDAWEMGVDKMGIGTMAGRGEVAPAAWDGLGVGTIPTEPPDSPPLPDSWDIFG